MSETWGCPRFSLDRGNDQRGPGRNSISAFFTVPRSTGEGVSTWLKSTCLKCSPVRYSRVNMSLMQFLNFDLETYPTLVSMQCNNVIYWYIITLQDLYPTDHCAVCIHSFPRRVGSVSGASPRVRMVSPSWSRTRGERSWVAGRPWLPRLDECRKNMDRFDQIRW